MDEKQIYGSDLQKQSGHGIQNDKGKKYMVVTFKNSGRGIQN